MDAYNDRYQWIYRYSGLGRMSKIRYVEQSIMTIATSSLLFVFSIQPGINKLVVYTLLFITTCGPFCDMLMNQYPGIGCFVYVQALVMFLMMDSVNSNYAFFYTGMLLLLMSTLSFVRTIYTK